MQRVLIQERPKTFSDNLFALKTHRAHCRILQAGHASEKRRDLQVKGIPVTQKYYKKKNQ
jgi:hypothetical protein